MVNGIPDVERFNAFAGNFLSSLELTATGGSPNLVLFGEMVALLCSGGNFDAALKLERLWNDLASKHSIHLHCAYPIKVFDRDGHSQAFLDICSEHSQVVPTENYTALAHEGDRSRQICRLQQRAITGTDTGRATLVTLLVQDLSVIPILALIPVLAATRRG